MRAEIPIRPGSIVVHSFKECGVTGVYLLVDLSLQCIEANEAVRPMELLKAIRAKRPGLIQTKEQMKFACESILVLHRMIQKGGRLNNRNLEE